MTRLTTFHNFVAIDWSGAAGERHRGIALALATQGDAAPRLLRPGHRWSRPEVLDWLIHDLPDATLVGFDLGISLPFVDRGAFFPGWADSPPDARALWELIDRVCADEPHLGVGSFVDHAEAAHHFRRHGGREGRHFGGGAGAIPAYGAGPGGHGLPALFQLQPGGCGAGRQVKPVRYAAAAPA